MDANVLADDLYHAAEIAEATDEKGRRARFVAALRHHGDQLNEKEFVLFSQREVLTLFLVFKVLHEVLYHNADDIREKAERLKDIPLWDGMRVHHGKLGEQIGHLRRLLEGRLK